MWISKRIWKSLISAEYNFTTVLLDILFVQDQNDIFHAQTTLECLDTLAKSRSLSFQDHGDSNKVCSISLLMLSVEERIQMSIHF